MFIELLEEHYFSISMLFTGFNLILQNFKKKFKINSWPKKILIVFK